MQRIKTSKKCRLSNGLGQNGIFTLTQGVEIQKPEGTRYDDLSKEEQDALDLDENGIDYRIDTIKVDILNICKQ